MLALFILFNLCFSATIYVNINSPAGSGGDGSSWALAFNNMQSALTAAGTSASTEIWAATGTYKPTVKYGGGYTGTDAQLVTFLLATNNRLYGGFVGTETSKSQRNVNANPTILSGDILGDDVYGSSSNKDDNAWHVMTADGATNVVVDGFIVEKGYAAGPDNGTVILAAGNTSVITSIAYAHALGAGLVARHGAQVTLNNMIFRDNQCNASRAGILTLKFPISALASGGGGIGIADDNTLVTVVGSKFLDNLAVTFGSEGGAANVIFDGTLQMTGCIVSGNKGNRNGGAVHNREGKKIIATSTTFSSNQIVGTSVGDEGGATIGVMNSNLTVTSCIFNSNIILAGTGPGGILFHTPFDDGSAYELRVISSAFSNNIGTVLGSAATIFGITPNAGVTAEIVSCVFTNNSAIVGGAVYVDSIPTKITSCVFNNNKAHVAGGAVFASNFANSIFNRTELATRTQLTVTSSSFNGNIITGSVSSAVPTFSFNFLAGFFSGGTASVTNTPVGAAGLASVFGAKVNVISSVFTNNNASPGYGGALLVGGSAGSVGGTPYGFNQAYLSVASSVGVNNVDQFGSNNVRVLNPAGLPNIPNGVYFLTDGSIV
uniref:Uncharacterized protein n=1 Tax=viral metagenome TaxID=1070528 RepID=A0A6C0C6T9_9ZZZZ